jgi:hypothetical protein
VAQYPIGEDELVPVLLLMSDIVLDKLLFVGIVSKGRFYFLFPRFSYATAGTLSGEGSTSRVSGLRRN